jgi:hypothetical protein
MSAPRRGLTSYLAQQRDKRLKELRAYVANARRVQREQRRAARQEQEQTQ